MEVSGGASGLLVTSYDGRPTKIEGNPEHPHNQGATDLYAQASTLELYDPDRSTAPRHRDADDENGQDDDDPAQLWKQFESQLAKRRSGWQATSGRGLRVLAEPSSSPTLWAARQKLLEAFPEAKWYGYEPLSRGNELAGSTAALGKAYRTHFDLSKAVRVVCLDADLLGSDPASVRYSREFAEARDPDAETMARLYVVESTFSTTGAAADHRLPLRAEQIDALARALEAEIVAQSDAADVEQHGKLAEAPHGGFLAEEPIVKFVHEVAADLVAHRGQSVVAIGARQPPHVHALGHRINALLGNIGQTVSYTAEPETTPADQTADFAALCDELRGGEIDSLLILGGNPVYDGPADCGFAEALSNVEFTAHLSVYDNETSRACLWHLPRAHYLESWGDARAWDGVHSVIQPLIEPLYNGRTAIELSALAAGGETKSGEELVRQTFSELAGSDASDGAWKKLLHDGFLAESGWATETPQLDEGHREAIDSYVIDEALLSVDPPGGDDLEIVFSQDASVYDGRFANSSWLQELPDFMTKLTWDNVALVSQATAKALGIKHSTLVQLAHGEHTVDVPAYIMPGQPDGSITVHLGYGRTAAGFVGGDVANEVEPVGVDFYRLRTSTAPHFARGLRVTTTNRNYTLASTQDHFAIDPVGIDGIEDRVGQLIREGTLDEYKHHPDFAQHEVHHPPLESLWDERSYEEADYKWGMAIDLNKCTGCNACVIACQAENNVPVVGKEQVRRGREMHWIRIDRYYSGDVANPRLVHQPVTCQQCEMAPCEQVCPVGATAHNSEGLNDMAYNRCIGTRYCSNNCPYKVRRFNYFNYSRGQYGKFQDTESEKSLVLQMVRNPEVTVRSRGVMEKCTFCVQRIRTTTIVAENERRPIADGEIKTACQQVCPSQAISFGDLQDDNAEVAKQHASPRAYAMLAELNVKPRNLFLARVRNPNPHLEAEATNDHSHHS